MKNIMLPYGKAFQTLCVEDSHTEVLQGHGDAENLSLEQQQAVVLKAIQNPVAAPGLESLAAGKNTATILISDHTRPVPSKLILPPMLAALREGQPNMKITLLVATGCHRGTSSKELTQKLGEELVQAEHIVVHDCDDESALMPAGVLPSGAPLLVNRLAVETDLLLSEGFIEPHFFAGFSGGRKSVLPGVCGRTTVMQNHCAAFIDHPCARTGILENNPVHTDMEAAARMVHLRWIVNVLMNQQKQVFNAFAGDPIQAHHAGCEVMRKLACVHPSRKADIVITTNGGYPLDQNVYQCVKGLSTAEACAAENAVIILCAQCVDGIGGEQFRAALQSTADPAALLAQIRLVSADQTMPDQWQYQILARILAKHRILFVTEASLRQAIEAMHMTYCPTVQAALELAYQSKGRNAHTLIIPDGVAVYCD